MRLLTGAAPKLDAVDESVHCRDGLFVAERVAEDGTVQELGFAVIGAEGEQAQGPLLQLRRAMERGSDGMPRWEAAYDDYQDFEGHPFPTEVRFVDHVHGVETSVRVRSVSLDPEIPDDVFSQAPAPGMSVEPASCP